MRRARSGSRAWGGAGWGYSGEVSEPEKREKGADVRCCLSTGTSVLDAMTCPGGLGHG